MQKLEKKGWLTHRVDGRAYVYRPVRSRATAQAGLWAEVLDGVFDGDPTLLVSQLLDARQAVALASQLGGVTAMLREMMPSSRLARSAPDQYLRP